MTATRKTWQKEAVRALLAGHHGFLSAQQLHDQLREEGSKMGLATVYRTLGALVESGAADSLQSPDGETIYRLCSTDNHHHHLICRQCGFAIDVAAPQVEEWAHAVAEEHLFTDASHVINVFGLCAKCSAK